MNKMNVQQAGGFPLETDTLDFMQKAYSELMALTALGGDNVIVSGCAVAGANITDGYVVIAGELLPFKGGLAQTKVVIKQDVTQMEFENGAVNDAYLVRYATFGNSEPNILFADLTRLSSLKALSNITARVDKLEKMAAPFYVAGGSMVLWRKPLGEIPAGWREVVDWRGRMPVGWNPADADFDALGEIGGSKTHQNSEEEAWPHDHEYGDTEPNGGIDFGSGSTRFSYTSIVTRTETTSKAGGYVPPGGGAKVAKPYSIMNPYRVVMFIEPIPE